MIDVANLISAITPLQARRRRTDVKLGSEMLKQGTREALSKNVGKLEIRRNKASRQLTRCNQFADKMVVNIDMFSTFVSNGILT